MTPSAANSVLKTLEEPTPRSLLILLTSQPSLLLPTVRSRCQKITIARPSPDAGARVAARRKRAKASSRALLEFAGGAPLRALEYADGRFDALDEHMQKSLGSLLSGRADVTQVAAEWAEGCVGGSTDLARPVAHSRSRAAALAGNADLVTFPGGPAHLPSLPRTLNISGVYSMVDRARALKAQLARTALQRELAVESWLIALLDVLAPPAASTQRLSGTSIRRDSVKIAW